MENQAALKRTPEDGGFEEYRNVEFCLHCGNDVPPHFLSDNDADEPFCCTGCRYVYELIHKLGLNDFYDLKDNQKLVPVSDFNTGNTFSYLDQDSFKKIYKSDQHEYCMKFYVGGISCTACLWLIEKSADLSDGIESVTLNMSNNVATVFYSDDNSYSSFPDIIKNFGFRPYPVTNDNESEKLRGMENRKFLYRIGVVAVCAGNIMLFSAAKYSGATGFFASNFDLASLLLSIPVVTYCSDLFYRNSFYSFINRRPSVDLPVVFVIVAGWLLSVVNYFGSGDVYFDSIALFVFLLLGSRYVLNNLLDKINNLHTHSYSLFPENKVLTRDENKDEFTYQPVVSISKGDIIKHRTGDRLQFDGFLASESAHLNLSVLTGESIPQYASKGDYLYAGTIIESDDILIRVDKKTGESRIGKLIAGIENKNILKSGYTGLSEKYSTVFTAIVGLISLTFFIVFYNLYGADEAFRRIIAYVLISCPCAFVFTLPISMSYSLKSALAKGLIIKNPNVFEKIRTLRNVFFDKTGTLTTGRFTILEWDLTKISEEDVKAIIAIEKMSGHPIARSMVSFYSNIDPELPEVTEFKYMPTKGVTGVIKGSLYDIVSEPTGSEFKDEVDQVITRLSVFKDKRLISTILLGDILKSDATFVLNSLRSDGNTVYLLSGDKESSVRKTADTLGISEKNIYWELTPEEKAELVGGHPDSMVIGDGINDAGALSVADVGVSIQGSIEESLKLSDVYLLRNELTSVIDLISHGITTGNAVRATILFSLLYNITAGVFALLGYINPLIAAILMPSSSVVLVIISLLMQRKLRRGPVYR